MIGDAMLRWARRTFDARTVETVFEPLIADLQHEHAEALDRGGVRAARRVALRGCWDLARTVALVVARERVAMLAALPWVTLVLPAIATAICGVVLVRASGVGLHRAQVTWVALGVGCMLGLATVRAGRSRTWLAAGAAALVLAASPLVFGTAAYGAKRWIEIGGLRLDALELGRPLIIVAIAGALSARRSTALAAGCLAAVALTAIALAQNHPGGAAVVLATLAGASAVTRRRALAAASFAAALVVILTTTGAPGAGPAEMARHTGGVLAGGIVAALALVATAVMLVGIGRRVLQPSDDASRTVAACALAGLGAQVVLFLGARADLIADVGLALPLISYGGSATVATLATIGLVSRPAAGLRSAAGGAR